MGTFHVRKTHGHEMGRIVLERTVRRVSKWTRELSCVPARPGNISLCRACARSQNGLEYLEPVARLPVIVHLSVSVGLSGSSC